MWRSRSSSNFRFIMIDAATRSKTKMHQAVGRNRRPLLHCRLEAGHWEQLRGSGAIFCDLELKSASKRLNGKCPETSIGNACWKRTLPAPARSTFDSLSPISKRLLPGHRHTSSLQALALSHFDSSRTSAQAQTLLSTVLDICNSEVSEHAVGLAVLRQDFSTSSASSSLLADLLSRNRTHRFNIAGQRASMKGLIDLLKRSLMAFTVWKCCAQMQPVLQHTEGILCRPSFCRYNKCLPAIRSMSWVVATCFPTTSLACRLVVNCSKSVDANVWVGLLPPRPSSPLLQNC